MDTETTRKALPTPAALSIAGAVGYSGMSRTRLYAELAAGRVRAVKAGRQTLVLRESLDALLRNLPAATFGPAPQETKGARNV